MDRPRSRSRGRGSRECSDDNDRVVALEARVTELESVVTILSSEVAGLSERVRELQERTAEIPLMQRQMQDMNVRLTAFCRMVEMSEDRHQGALRALGVPISQWSDRSAWAVLIHWLRHHLRIP